MPEPQWWIEVGRGGLVESRHRVLGALVDSQGRLLWSSGSAEQPVFLRSAAKPFQALTVVLTGAADRWGLEDWELAILCASHPGGPEHLAAVLSVLEKIREGEEALRCGPHWPSDERTSLALHARGEQPRPLHNNCSGKHAGMLAAAKHLGAPLETYLEPEHPVQRWNRRVLATLCSVEEEAILLGVDGCGVPTFALPLRAAALGYARLAHPQGLPPDWEAACRRIVRAMTTFPHLVQPGFACQWMQVSGGRWVVKGGAEGYLGAGGVGQGIGLAVKNEDGSHRGLPTLVLQVLESLGLLRAEELQALEAHRHPPVLNTRGERVGEIRVAQG